MLLLSDRGADALGEAARAGGRVADVVAGIELRAHFGRIDEPHDAFVAGEQLRERVRLTAPSASYAAIAFSRIASCSS